VKPLALILAGALIVGPAPGLATSQPKAPPAPEQPMVVISFVITQEDARRCRAGSGCDVYHIDQVNELIERAVREARRAGRAEACKGPST
jgi:hypothetical protein